jgi:hypothetical protein
MINKIQKDCISIQEQIFLLRDLADSPYKFIEEKRDRTRYSIMKILYQLHLLGKNVKNGKWRAIYPREETLASWAGISPWTVSKYINSHQFSVFGKVEQKPYISNRYELHNWVTEWFNVFERLGMMRGFKTDPKKWLKRFKKRIDSAILPLVSKGLTAKEVMNQLLTKRPSKSHTVPPSKSHTTTFPTTLSGYRSKIEAPPNDPILKNHEKMCEQLRNRFRIDNGDINFMMRSFSLNELRGAYNVADLWLSRGMEVKSPVKMFMAAITANRNRKFT